MTIIRTLFLVAVAGCSSAPQINYYVLASPADRGALQSSRPVSERVLRLGRVTLADYLRRPGLVLETEAHRIRPAQYHRWGEPLEYGVRRALLENLSSSLPGMRVENGSSQVRPDYRLEVEIERFHGTEVGLVVLSGRWTLYTGAPGRLVASEQFDLRDEIAASGYRASVETQATLLASLSRTIASHVPEVEAGAREG